jgi:hypothetical protein
MNITIVPEDSLQTEANILAAIAGIREQRYLDSLGNKCPFCNSPFVESTGPFEPDGGYVWQPIYCRHCEKTWQDQYRLVGIQEE